MKLIFLQLNEINFDIVKKYIDKGYQLKTFDKIMKKNLISTSSEESYENLEPWIQWVSVHTGLSYDDHKVFRLGDILNHKHEQFFEKIEKLGFKVGAISPMNAKNNLKKAGYFIPDPWTQTKSDESFISRILTQALSQAVNDNAKSKITLSSLLKLFIVFVLLIPFISKIKLAIFAATSIFKPWRKSLFLDLFLFEVHQQYFKKKKVDFSSLFLNAGAHIQHHYFFNSKALEKNKLVNPSWYIKPNNDPVYDMLITYDKLIEVILNLEDTEVIIATGLSQKPYDRVKFYYRLRDHSEFLRKFKIQYKSIYPRMTRDFLITFENKSDQEKAFDQIKNIKVDHKDFLFGEIEKMDNSLFVTLTYPYEITENTYINLNEKRIKLLSHVVFVAVKNGMHQSRGFAFFSDGIKDSIPRNNEHVLNINKTVLSFFNL